VGRGGGLFCVFPNHGGAALLLLTVVISGHVREHVQCRCAQSVVHPQVANGGTATRYGELLRICSTRGGPPAWGLAKVLTTLRHKHLGP
jgi:hypothetical protein